MEKLKFAMQVFTLLLAFPVITILELNRSQQSIQLNESTKIEMSKAGSSCCVNIAGTNMLFKNCIHQHDTGNKKGHNKYAL